METDIGNPIEYTPNLDPLIQEKNEDNNKDDSRSTILFSSK